VRIMVVGAGGREHALAWKCAASSRVSEVLVAPGNAGTAAESKVRNLPVGAQDIAALAQAARAHQVDLTLVGPEAPLAAGIVDAFEALGLPCLGPTRQAAQLESSKAFAKDFLVRHGIPTAASRTFTRDSFDAAWVRAQRAPLVVKASGLAAGKGVVITADAGQAVTVAQQMLAGSLGSAGREILVEEFLEGEEASFIILTDGRHVLTLPSSQDHKRLLDGDAGPNTGGMGAYSPAPVITPALTQRIQRQIITPTLAGLAADGIPYRGFLYAGLMISPAGDPAVLEFNCRLGDPETQPILMRLKSELVPLAEHALAGTLDQVRPEWDAGVALGVVMAAAGYPGEVRQGDVICGLDAAAALPGKIFHAGTLLRDGVPVTAGGRVLCAAGSGATIREAQRAAYALVDALHWPGMQCRRDIGHRALTAQSLGDSTP
jgi:phosphoribosylamine---glycine ligase